MPSRKKRNEESERERPGEAQPASQRPLRRARNGQPTPPAPSPAAESVPEPSPLVAEFAATEPFPLDPFQIEACQHLAAGRSVLVAAPTGTGKTVVADCAIWLAQRNGLRAIYTAPVKALSNQKYRDLRARHGDARVGLLTGDIVENPAAPILVMTTEIYRNMLLEGLTRRPRTAR